MKRNLRLQNDQNVGVAQIKEFTKLMKISNLLT